MREILKEFKEGFMEFGSCVTIVVNVILLSFVYFVGVGITSIIAKLLKRNFLDIKKVNTKTYWSELNLKKQNIEKYYKQF